MKAFSNMQRLKMLICLGKSSKNVSELVCNCGLSQSAVSQHLAKLREAGVLRCERAGREQYYRVADEELLEVAEKILNLYNKHSNHEKSKRCEHTNI